MSATAGRTAGRMKKLIGSQLAGPVLALMIVQQSAARSRRESEK